KISDREPLRQDASLGEKDWARWPPRSGGGLAADDRRNADLSFDGRCVQLDVHRLSSGDRIVLFGSAGKVQCLQQEFRMVEAGPILLWRHGASRYGGDAAQIFTRHRSPDGKDRVGV